MEGVRDIRSEGVLGYRLYLFASEEVRHRSGRIGLSLINNAHELIYIGEVTLARQESFPASLVPVTYIAGIEEEMCQILLGVDAEVLARFDQGVEQCRYLRSGRCPAEEEVLPSYDEGAYLVFNGLCEITHKPLKGHCAHMSLAQRIGSSARVSTELMLPPSSSPLWRAQSSKGSTLMTTLNSSSPSDPTARQRRIGNSSSRRMRTSPDSNMSEVKGRMRLRMRPGRSLTSSRA